MNVLIFYEKPGCVGNQRQKVRLRAQDISFRVEDLLATRWTIDTLRPFFGCKPVAEWFNASAPAVKLGELDIHALDEEQALILMLAEPLLICRPLLEYGDLRQSGFMPGPVLDALGVNLTPEQDLQSCPAETRQAACEVRS